MKNTQKHLKNTQKQLKKKLEMEEMMVGIIDRISGSFSEVEEWPVSTTRCFSQFAHQTLSEALRKHSETLEKHSETVKTLRNS